MLKKRGRRRLWAVLGTMLLAAALGVCALAASDVPKAVLNARESVVRIVTEGAMGSGFALSENSVYVVTNHHVIEGAETIEVIVDDTRWTTARVYVDLPGKDICILKTDKPLRGMPGLPLRSDAVETGLAVYALGYPGAADDFSREFATGVDSITVTDGIVSAVRQSRAEGLQTTWAIQTNTPISPGNSGGGLFNERGELIGIVNAKSSGQNAEGLGFAIPVNTAIQVAEELINNGYVTGRPAMGVTVLSINDAQTAFQYGVNQAGVYVQSVNEGGAADKAGLQPGDRFVSIDGTAVNSTSDITGIIGEHAVGDTIEVQVVRGTQIVTANVTLEESTPQASSTQRTEG